MYLIVLICIGNLKEKKKKKKKIWKKKKKLSPMKCQSLFSGKNKENIINLSSAELAQKVAEIIFSLFIPLQLIFLITGNISSEMYIF